MEQAEQTPGIGHNVSPFQECQDRTDELLESAKAFLGAETEINDDNEEAVADYINQINACIKKTDECRKADKKPHDDAGKAVQKQYLPLATRLDKAKKYIGGKLQAYLRQKQLRIDEERRQQEEEARRLREEADRKAVEAAPHDLDAQIEAEESQKQADQVARDAAKTENAKAASSLGKSIGLRTIYQAEITDLDECLAHYKGDPKIREVLQMLANADIRAKRPTPPGCRRITKT